MEVSEKEWLACNDPKRLFHAVRGIISDRKFRLFACACCRQAYHLMTHPHNRKAVEVAERHADGMATEAEVWQATAKSRSVPCTPGAQEDPCLVCMATTTLRHEPQVAAPWFSKCLPPVTYTSLLRDIVGNPFRPLRLWMVNGAEPWSDGLGWVDARHWVTPTVLRIAKAAYAGRDFAALPVLADALEDAGCRVDDLLTHLRGPGPHALGCWALDFVLGKS